MKGENDGGREVMEESEKRWREIVKGEIKGEEEWEREKEERERGKDDQLMIFPLIRLVVYQMKRSHFLW